MSVETMEVAQDNDSENKLVNGGDRPNGMSNGHSDKSKSHKSSSKDKHRDKDRERDRDKDRDREKDKNRDKDRDRDKDKEKRREKDKEKDSKSSSSKDKEKRDKDREKDKDRGDKDKDRKDRDKEKDKDRHGSSHKSSTKDKDRDKDKRRDEKDRDKDKEKDKDKERSKDKDRDREKDKSKSSSSRDKEKERERDRDKDKDKEKSKSSSSSSKDKEKHSSSSSSKPKDKERSDRDKDKDKHSSSSSKDKDRERKERKEKERRERKEREKAEIKEEKDEVKEESNDLVEIPVKDPLEMSQASSCDYSMSQFRNDETPFDIKAEAEPEPEVSDQEVVKEEEPEEEEEYQPEPEVKEEPVDEGSEEDVPLAKRKKEEDEDDDEDFSFKKKKKIKSEKKAKKGKKRQYESEEEADEDYEEEYEEKKKSKNKKVKKDKTKKQVKQEIEEEVSPKKGGRKKKEEEDEDDNEDFSFKKKKKIKSEKKAKKGKKRQYESEEEADEDYEEEYEEKKKSKNKKVKKDKTKKVKQEIKEEVSPKKGGRKKKEEEEQEVWKWWEEEKKPDGVKWNFLEHKGPVFAPEYEPLPDKVKFEYDGKSMRLSPEAEEIATFYARMIEHEYTSKKVFNDNFFKDWRKYMTDKEREKIKDLFKCNFKYMHAHFAEISERNKSRSKEEKLKIKEDNEAMLKEYGFCTIDGHKEKIGNFRIEPPGLFRGRGEHPKMGMVKRRVQPEDIVINCAKDSHAPVPPKGHKWKEVRHDNSVTWLASWTENVQGQVKYIMLNPSSKLKGEKDWQKYETARKLLKHIEKIRNTYRDEWKSKEMRIRQRAVALYFIDKLALRAGNEKDEDQADTVGCCSLRVEHIQLHKEMGGKENVVVFDFLGKDSIRYYNEVEVEKRVFKNLELFMENKKDGDDLFDRLNTTVLNEHLRDLMDGLTAKVFRTFNASYTLQKQLTELTDPDMSVPEKLLAYNRANRAVAILCNHQRAVPKSHDKSMSNLKEKIKLKREAVDDLEEEIRGLKRDRVQKDKKTKQLERLRDQLKKLELQETDRDENKTIALGTSKLNYLDPRISVAWCKKFDVPIEKIFNKTQRDKFRWAIEMADEDYVF